ncbi:hypothetical protein PF005_g14969 [Phytophthora fragariae]|uniref:Uncharacterized protein n=1 Tax=Phytophthora fragariae TaxID=53985 RepID=A0A6A4D0M7_9STRA|nr:hypothetical protein PF003_g28672 [Phytophthora fragariae]KAE8944394.1 hypothetical protein PF009_g5926 [Phytophthora fragariae]KAE9091886.1 hypothetical protein PF010_g18011 [Phytophthora fragariae]KAE9101760.1 hypothetical protein PF007_g15013 [Phytophthora fragariae]KAE9125847.1 hypothetical protein PF006_g16860 [Phytophthora fragariae]
MKTFGRIFFLAGALVCRKFVPFAQFRTSTRPRSTTSSSGRRCLRCSLVSRVPNVHRT